MAVNNISKEKLVEMFRKMLEVRRFEEKVIELFGSGQLAFATGFIHLYVGEEAVAVGVCSNLDKDDYITSTHRGHGHCIAKGARLDRMMAELFGKETGYCKGKGGSMHIADKTHGILGTSGIVGAGIPIAVGAGLSAKLRGTRQVSISFFGDGASNTGAFHEGMNLAGVWKLPVVFVCENNLYGCSVSLSKSMAVKDIVERARGYGFPGMIVDGMDVVAVYQAARKAVKRARDGQGPTFIECKTYRYRGHYEGEAWQEAYRTREEVEEWRKRDAIILHRKRLIDERIISKEEANQMEKEVVDEVEQAARFAMESPLPPVKEALTDIYA